MTFDEFKSDPDLVYILRNDLSENGIGISFDKRLLQKDGDLNFDKVCILKLDDYVHYNSRTAHNPPKVIDGLVIMKCCDESYRIFLVELRRSEGKRPTKRLHPSVIEEKFVTATSDFMEQRYAAFFSNIKLKSIQAYLVSDPWGQSAKENGSELFQKRIKSSALDAYGSRRPLRVFGKNVLINPILPPQPTIQPCYPTCA